MERKKDFCRGMVYALTITEHITNTESLLLSKYIKKIYRGITK